MRAGRAVPQGLRCLRSPQKAQSRRLQLAHGSDIHMADLPHFPQSGLAPLRERTRLEIQ
jgi:hypothetical protein